MKFEAERFSTYFRRSLVALDARLGDGPARERLAGLVAEPLDDAVLQGLLASESAAVPVETALRRARNWMMLALIERDVRGDATLDEVCRTMTDFARRSLALALAEAAAPLVERHGRPLDRDGRPQDMLVVGMGKAGGDELNVSSDLDLVFLFRGEGESEGSAGGGGRIASSEWMHRLARRTIALLSEITADGFVFRVDTRLRPNGDSGPLVVPLGMLEHYFLAQGREWERFAWLKGRVLADSGMAGARARTEDEAQLAQIVEPFVFRRYMDYEAFAALRDLHRLIRSEVTRRAMRDPQAIDVKLGPGGIREIEFTAQLFQVVRGGRDPGLRDPRTLVTLAALAERGLLPPEEADQLADAYRLLRRTEHALQYRDDAQTHRLPRDPAVRADVAAMLRMTPETFDRAIDEATETVSQIFDRLLSPTNGDGEENADDDAAEPVPIDAEVERRFALFRSGARYAASRESTREAIERLLAEAVRQRTGNDGLIRLVDLLDTVCRRPAYVALLAQFPQAFERVLRILDWAKWPAEYLMQHPVVLDELLDGALLEPTDYDEWSNELAERVAAARIGDRPDVERQMDIVREAHHAQVFKLMVQDLENRLTVERVSDHLSELADRVLDLAIGIVWSQLRQRFREVPRFAVIGYGRLGGKELGYASDLDLVFLFDDDDERAPEAYAMLAQRLAAWLSTRTAAGLLFEIDLRLRPDGAAGMLVSRIGAFESYQRKSAWAWEHQALTRARFCAGDASIGERFESIRREVLAQRRDLGKLRDDVVAMRAKMHEGHPNRSTLFDLKHDRGGMVDIEFIVQYLVLAHSADHPQLLDNKGNIALLGSAARVGLIDEALAAAVADAYRRYRRLQHRLRLDDVEFARLEPQLVANERNEVLTLWRQVFGADRAPG
ncbi:MAG: bifunctional [glutamate--ammonia ligase]-adenylyl-L-tyrosine phosphorylase/[glutamate--ammonia-ligase] adenylyltransferase [Limnobacter sp.]|nr:bifunctional [glutamate--ammonia ligase]-adenylyl-L-tyrosine phosphorylase/[glutamate--ammonia-ligase] adenylyltransferase [Limnobacter sp.]